MPQEWLSSLRKAGLSDEEILAIHIRRQQQKEKEQREQMSNPAITTSPVPYSSSTVSSHSSNVSTPSPPSPPTMAPVIVAVSPPRADSLGHLTQQSDLVAPKLFTPLLRVDRINTSPLNINHPYGPRPGNSPVSPSEASMLTVTDGSNKEDKSGTTPTTPVSQNILYALKSFSPGLGLAPEAQPLRNSSVVVSSLENVERATSLLEKAASMADSTTDSCYLDSDDQKRLSDSFSVSSSNGKPPQRMKRRPAELSLVPGGSASHSRTRSETSLLYTPPLLPPPTRPPPSPPHTPDAVRDCDTSTSVNSLDGARSPSLPTIILPSLTIETSLDDGLNWMSASDTGPPRLSLPESLDVDLGDWSESLFSVLRRQTSTKSVSQSKIFLKSPSEESESTSLQLDDPSPSNALYSNLSVTSSSSIPATINANDNTNQLSTEHTSEISIVPSNVTTANLSPNPDYVVAQDKPHSIYSESTTPLSPLFDEVLGLVSQTVASPSRQDCSPILPRPHNSIISERLFSGEFLEAESSNPMTEKVSPASSVTDLLKDAYASLSPRTATWSETSSGLDSSHSSLKSLPSPMYQNNTVRLPSRSASPQSMKSCYSRSSGASSRMKSVASTSKLSDDAMRPAAKLPTVRIQLPHEQSSSNSGSELAKDELSPPFTNGLHRSASTLVHDWIVDSTASVLAYEQEEDLDDELSVYGLEAESEQHKDVESPSDSLKSQSQRPLPHVLLPMSPTESTPLTPDIAPEKYRGWLSEVLSPLEEFLNDADPHKIFTDLQEIAEGEHGSVYAARVIRSYSSENQSLDDDMVAIKNMPMTPSGSPKLQQLRRELLLMSRIRHDHILSMTNLYVDLTEDALWIQMELMERSLADVLALVAEGLSIDEEIIGRFIHDVSVFDIFPCFNIYPTIDTSSTGILGKSRYCSSRCSI